MTNFEYIKTLSENEMLKFITETMFETFNEITYEMCSYWREEEAQAAALDMWKEWLSEEHNDDNKDTPQRIHHNLVSKAESVLDKIKERFPDTEITIEAPLGKSTTVRLKDANIYVAVNNSRLALCA